MDFEWAYDAMNDKLYIVQARPATTASQKKVGVIEDYKMKKLASTGNDFLFHASVFEIVLDDVMLDD
eukprot:9569973-Heterocapsa_arctica.AAC.1